MTNPSPLLRSLSPPKSAFQWPAPLSPRLGQVDQDTTATNTDLPLKEILEKYKNDADILRHILLAKAEEDKRQAARDILKTEQARIHLKQLDLEYLREQSMQQQRQYDKFYYQQHTSTGTPAPTTTAPIASSLPLPVPLAPPPSIALSPSSYSYDLAPVQRQVLARITGGHSSSHYSNQYEYQPCSPVAYPHSAHPLCPPADLRNSRNSHTVAKYNSTPPVAPPNPSSSHHFRHRLQPPSINTSTSTNSHQPSTPVSPAIGNSNGTHDDIPTSATISRYNKRTRHSISDQSDDKLSHNKVMEALKAKIQRGNGSPVSTTPSSSLPYRSSFSDTIHTMDKRQRQLPKPIVTTTDNETTITSTTVATMATTTTTNAHRNSTTNTVHTPSPRSAKPILPPIDTSVGRQQQQQQQQQQPHHHHHHHHHLHHRRRSSSPVHLPTSTPSTAQVSPSDQLLAVSTRQERSSSHSTPSDDTYEHDTHSTIKMEMD